MGLLGFLQGPGGRFLLGLMRSQCRFSGGDSGFGLAIDGDGGGMACLSLEQRGDTGLDLGKFPFQRGNAIGFGLDLFSERGQAGLRFVTHRHFVGAGRPLVSTDDQPGIRFILAKGEQSDASRFQGGVQIALAIFQVGQAGGGGFFRHGIAPWRR